jgi:hypothetical protein
MTRLQLLRRRLGLPYRKPVGAAPADIRPFATAQAAEGLAFETLATDEGRIIHE